MTMRNRLRTEWRNLAVVVVLLSIGGFFLSDWVSDSWDQIQLMNRAVTTPGNIIALWEDIVDSYEGPTRFHHEATYAYRIDDGRVFEGIEAGSGRIRDDIRKQPLPIPVEVEYLPDNPSVSRIKGSGATSFVGILRSGSLIFAVIFLAMGGYALWVTIQGMRRTSNTSIESLPNQASSTQNPT